MWANIADVDLKKIAERRKRRTVRTTPFVAFIIPEQTLRSTVAHYRLNRSKFTVDTEAIDHFGTMPRHLSINVITLHFVEELLYSIISYIKILSTLCKNHE